MNYGTFEYTKMNPVHQLANLKETKFSTNKAHNAI